MDVPDSVLGQLGNRVQHALRAFTPRDQKAVKATAQTMRPKAGLDIEAAITELAVGEALVSFLDAKGRPSETERAFVYPPGSQLGPITDAQRRQLIASSLVAGVYEKTLDRESAYEKLRQHAAAQQTDAGQEGKPSSTGAQPADPEASGKMNEILFGRTGPRGGQTDGLVQTLSKTVVRTVGSSIGRQIVRGILGGLLGGRR
jgi:DNA helicase HerA-like ATPase